MAIKCKGCGIEIQTIDPKALGYSPKAEAQYCQRCFRMTHYDDVQISMKKGIDEGLIMDKAAKVEGLVIWVIDCFDLEAGILKGMMRHFIGRDVLLVVSKCDLLPKTFSDEKLHRFMLERLKEWQFNPVGMSVIHKGNQDDIDELKSMIEMFRKGRNVLFMGKANAGKSTLLNQLIKSNQLTVTRYPGTTLDFNEIEVEGYTVIDTPGLLNKESLLIDVDEKDLKTILPDSRVKPQIYQLWEPQSFAIGGLARIDCKTKSTTSIVFYLGSRLSLHRGKVESANELWLNHQGELLNPTVNEAFKDWKTYNFRVTKKKMDVCIAGLGWFTVEGPMEEVVVKVPSNVAVISRKAMM